MSKSILTDQEKQVRDQYLTEALGMCWHDWKHPLYQHDCSRCGARLNAFVGQIIRIDFSSWEGFGILWTWHIARSGLEPGGLTRGGVPQAM